MKKLFLSLAMALAAIVACIGFAACDDFLGLGGATSASYDGKYELQSFVAVDGTTYKIGDTYYSGYCEEEIVLAADSLTLSIEDLGPIYGSGDTEIDAKKCYLNGKITSDQIFAKVNGKVLESTMALYGEKYSMTLKGNTLTVTCTGNDYVKSFVAVKVS